MRLNQAAVHIIVLTEKKNNKQKSSATMLKTILLLLPATVDSKDTILPKKSNGQNNKAEKLHKQLPFKQWYVTSARWGIITYSSSNVTAHVT